MKILCVEDDEGLARLLQKLLLKQHYQVEIATDGQTGWGLIETFAYDLILLDWMLPGMAGIEFCQRLRMETRAAFSHNRDVPILLMTALDAVTNKVMGLNAGADDYIVKPFDPDELLARIQALLRRSQRTRSPLLHWGELCLNPNSCEVTYQGRPIVLTAKEYGLLELFLRHPDQIFSLERLLLNLWTLEEMPSEGAVRAHIKCLRQKLKQAGADELIETIYKMGYRLKQRGEDRDGGLRELEPVELNKSGSLLLSAPSAASAQFARSAPSAASARSSQSALIPAEYWDAWQACRQSYCDRLAVIQNTLTGLQQETLTLEQQQQAAQEAHTLVGSLGSFGLEEASQISRQIQQILKQPVLLGQLAVEQLSSLIAALRLHLEDLQEDKSQANKSAQSAHFEKVSDFLPLSFPVPTLLIVDDDLPLTDLLAKEAVSWGLQAKIAATLDDAQQALRDGSVNAMLLDAGFSDATGNGLDFLATVHCQYPDVPVIVLSAEETFERRVSAVRLGGRCFLQKPIAPAQVLAAVTQVLQQATQSLARILIVDDDPALLQLLNTLLKPCGYQVTALNEPQHFWQVLEQVTPDLLILDVELCQSSNSESKTQRGIPPLSGIELCQVIRSDPRWNRLPVLFLSAHADIETVQRGFVVGADDFLNKPVVAQELLTRVQARLEQRKLWKSNDLDELTGVSLRRKALLDLTRLVQLAQRQQQPFSLAVLDLDHFKQVNDEHGHATGDQVLGYLGRLLRCSFRQEDVVGRWGGEEFIVGMYGITKQDGIKRLEAVLSQLEQSVFLARNKTAFRVTFSAGIAQLAEDGDELQILYCCADRALYQAKSIGRNRIVAAASPHDRDFPLRIDRCQEPS